MGLSPVAIVGLGNPGERYSNTRHNVGFQALDYLSKIWNVEFVLKEKWNAQVAFSPYACLIKPQTFMNSSGQSISLLMTYFHWQVERILVIYDDAELPFGEWQLSLSSSGSGGHNGIRSIGQHFKTMHFPRLKIGIGKNPKMPLDSYVLSNFSTEESSFLQNILASVAKAVQISVLDGLQEAVHQFSKKKK